VENRWIKAATILPPTLKVCGRRLLPFCLRHRVALEAIESPLIFTSKTMSAIDLIVAVRILASYDITEVRKPMTMSERWHLARLSISEDSLIEEAKKVVIYFEAQSLWPRFWAKDERTEGGGLSWHLAVIANLIRNGCTLTEAWTMPEAEAIWLHIAHSKAAGAKVDIVSDREWDAMEDYKRKEKASKQNPTNRN
jgi:hypothetical protein